MTSFAGSMRHGSENGEKSRRLIDDITVLILTFNEAENIGRTLAALNWAPNILVVDSGSTDQTLEIVGSVPQARIAYRKFDSFADQCNFGLDLVATPWTLSLDADYVLSSELVDEICNLNSDEIASYSANFVYKIYGSALKRTLYPARIVLYRTAQARYTNEGHGHKVNVTDPKVALKGVIFHDDRKPLGRWLASQQRYAAQEADYLLSASNGTLRIVDRLRRTGWAAPLIVFLYTLFWKRCILEGVVGWTYSLQRLYAEVNIALEILDRRILSQVKEKDSRDLS